MTMFLQNTLLAEETFTNLEFNCNMHRAEKHSSCLKTYTCGNTPQHLAVRYYPPESADSKISIPILMRRKSSRNLPPSQPLTAGLALPVPLPGKPQRTSRPLPGASAAASLTCSGAAPPAGPLDLHPLFYFCSLLSFQFHPIYHYLIEVCSFNPKRKKNQTSAHNPTN